MLLPECLTGTNQDLSCPRSRSCRNGQLRAIRDRLAPDEYERLLDAVRAGVSKRELAKQYGISLRTVYRVAATAT